MTRQCRECMDRLPEGQVFTAQRKGGGTFRRGGRWYWSSICHGCAIGLVGDRTEPDHAGQTLGSWSARGLISHLDTMGLLP